MDMEFKVGDRVLYSQLDKSILHKAIITSVDWLGYYQMIRIDDDIMIYRSFKKDAVRLDKQYYREERLKKLLD